MPKSVAKTSVTKKTSKPKASVVTKASAAKKIPKRKAVVPGLMVTTDRWGGHKVLAWKGAEVPESLMGVIAVQYRETKAGHLLAATVKDVFWKLPTLQRLGEKDPHARNLCSFVEKEFKEQLHLIRSNIAKGLIQEDGIWILFPEGTEVVFDYAGVHVGGIVESISPSFYGFSFRIRGHFLDTAGISVGHTVVTLPYFSGLKTISSLGVKPLTPELKKKFMDRGARTRDLLSSNSRSYLSYDGNLFTPSFFGTRKHRATGRVMIDAQVFERISPDAPFLFKNHDDRSSAHAENSVLEDWCLSPLVRGFSFTLKRWGEFDAELLSPIVFQTQAYHQLVLPDREINGKTVKIKSILRSLVESTSKGVDFIDGKGGGTVFLLHGPPGGGKTLTAEAIAELLQRPLYPVSAGELGTTPESLEKSLRSVLDIATSWDAVLLIDESDVYLEERTTDDLQRNALVAIFLRLLEYYAGVLFLTTNRVKNFDKAFHSRLSLVLSYPAHGCSERQAIWTNILMKVGISFPEKQMVALSEHELNGRQIKHMVHLAMALAKSENRPLECRDFDPFLALAKDFAETLDRPEPVRLTLTG